MYSDGLTFFVHYVVSFRSIVNISAITRHINNMTHDVCLSLTGGGGALEQRQAYDLGVFDRRGHTN